ncbi:alkaline phosphatase [Vibrio maritimus]|uniref:Alkaline phosphatase n=1 Tax=Vibrio maritimus TaxID=990268 RepID=A0A090S7C0_9VIBR|nr:alkaline phosphatase [Vibrio maritimus]
MHLPEIRVPEFNLNGFDLSGFSLFGTSLSGREFFGFEIPDFEIPEFEVPDFSLGDYVDMDSLTIPAQAVNIPVFEIPNVIGIDWSERLPSFDHHYYLLQENEAGDWGDVMLALGDVNRLMGGGGDDVAIGVGRENIVYTGRGNDIAIMIGAENTWRDDYGENIAVAIGKKNTLHGGFDNDVMLAIGMENTLKGSTGDNFMAAIGNKNSISGDASVAEPNTTAKNVIFALGNENTVRAGFARSTVLTIGVKNDVKTTYLDDYVVSVGVENTVQLHKGKDVAFVMGIDNDIYGDDVDPFGSDNDVIVTAGMRNLVDGGGGNDGLFAGGLFNNVIGGTGDDLIVSMGGGSIVNGGTGNDVIATIGGANTVTGGLGNDFAINMGLANVVSLGEDNDTVLNIGLAGVSMGGDGDDVFLNLGWETFDLLTDSGATIVNNVLGGITDFMGSVVSAFGGDKEDSIASLFSFDDQSISLGNTGNDVFVAGFGSAQVTGGVGSDSYRFTLGSGRFDIYETADDSDINSLFIQRNANQADLSFSLDNLVLSEDQSQLDIVFNNESLGEIGLSGWGDNDVFEVEGLSSLTFADLKLHWDNMSDTAATQLRGFSAFDSAAALQAGAEATVAWLQDGEAGKVDFGSMNEGLTNVVDGIISDMHDAKTKIDNAVSLA